jgi:lysyl-tRNA synthetase class 1
MLLNLVQACSTPDEKVIRQFVDKYIGNCSKETISFMHKMIKFAVSYYKDFIANSRVPEAPNELQREALSALKLALEKASDKSTAEELQNIVFEVGKKFFENIRDWFLTLYRVLFGAESGPRMGSFISLYGVKNMMNLIEERVSNGTK